MATAILPAGEIIGEQSDEVETAQGEEPRQKRTRMAQKDCLKYKWTKKVMVVPPQASSGHPHPIVSLTGRTDKFLFFMQDFLPTIKEESERRARYLDPSNKFEVSLTEIRIFLGILIVSGYHPLPSKRHHWSSEEDMGEDLVQSAMSRKRFEEVLRFLHLAGNANLPSNDKMATLRPLTNFVT